MIVWKNRNTDTASNCDIVTIDKECIGDCINDALRQFGNIFDMLGIRLNDGKFIAAKTRQRIAPTQKTSQSLGHLLEELITDGVSKCVVDFFEVIQIKTNDCDPFVLTFCVGQRLL